MTPFDLMKFRPNNSQVNPSLPKLISIWLNMCEVPSSSIPTDASPYDEGKKRNYNLKKFSFNPVDLFYKKN